MEPGPGQPKRIGIPVDSDEESVRAKTRKNGSGVPPRPHGGVDVHLAAPDTEPLQHRIHENRQVVTRSARRNGASSTRGFSCRVWPWPLTTTFSSTMDA